jgi:hypothetical protein
MIRHRFDEQQCPPYLSPVSAKDIQKAILEFFTKLAGERL